VLADSCRFEDVGDVAFTWDYEGWIWANSPMSPLRIFDSRFVRCGRVADWGGFHPAFIRLDRDTLEDCGPMSIRAAVKAGDTYQFPPLGDSGIRDLVAIRQRGRLFDLSLRSQVREGEEPPPTQTKLWLERLVVQGGGDTVGVVRTVDDEAFTSEVALTDSRFDGASGPGVWISAHVTTVTSNTFKQVAGHALELAADVDSAVGIVRGNTVLGNGGDGIRVSGVGGVPMFVEIQNNLIVQNAGDGLHVGSPTVGSIAFNDAWLNYGAAYSGGGDPDSNLTVDPVFCDLGAGDLSVSSVSPCAPSGLYGQIGAHGVGCTRLADTDMSTSAAAPLAWPNPALAWVDLAPGRTARAWWVEVFDINGRRVWKCNAPRGASSVRWSGLSASGARVSPGLYWVRFKDATATLAAARLVWLE
jgi:hypothetical protein